MIIRSAFIAVTAGALQFIAAKLNRNLSDVENVGKGKPILGFRRFY